jgi:hypothetical protein
LSEFKRKIEIYKNHFWDFYNKQNVKVQDKIDWTVTLVQTNKIVPEKYFKHLTKTNGLWEIRVSADNGIFRIFCFFDKGNLIEKNSPCACIGVSTEIVIPVEAGI